MQEVHVPVGNPCNWNQIGKNLDPLKFDPKYHLGLNNLILNCDTPSPNIVQGVPNFCLAPTTQNQGPPDNLYYPILIKIEHGIYNLNLYNFLTLLLHLFTLTKQYGILY